MHNALIVGGAISVAVWAYLLFARGGFWRVTQLPTSQDSVNQSSRTIVAVIPARNESDVIGRAVTSLLHQQTTASLTIVVVDDGSSDGTSEAAIKAASDSRRTKDVLVLEGKPLRDGWSGKVWAQKQGVDKALEFDPDFLLLTDADIEHAPENISALLAIAGDKDYDLTSFMVKLHCESWFERWLIPAFVFFFFMLYPPAWIWNTKNKTAGAAGGCMLIRTDSLAKAGGLEAIRAEIIDDCALARAIKRTGGRVWLSATTTARSIRPYASVTEIGQMISRSAFNQLNHSALLLLGTVVGLAAIFLLPVAALFTSGTASIALGTTAFTAMMLAYAPTVRFYQLNPAWGLTLPAAALFYIGATIHSALKYWSGTGGVWKGRVQDR